jgi:hypothetical protein
VEQKLQKLPAFESIKPLESDTHNDTAPAASASLIIFFPRFLFFLLLRE